MILTVNGNIVIAKLIKKMHLYFCIQFLILLWKLLEYFLIMILAVNIFFFCFFSFKGVF